MQRVTMTVLEEMFDANRKANQDRQEMSLEEINAEIAAYRKDRKFFTSQDTSCHRQ